MDRETITKELAKPLDRALVKPPPKGKYGDFVPAFDIFTAANRIFGWYGWSDAIIGDVEVVWSGVVTVQKNRETVEQFRATVRVTVSVTVYGDDSGATHHVGVGYGHGFSKPENPGDAIESAGKEAETDAVKRALRKFGNPLGLALYDKEQKHVSDDPDYDPKAVADRLLEALKHTADCDLGRWKAANSLDLNRLKHDGPLYFEAVLEACFQRAKQNETEKETE